MFHSRSFVQAVVRLNFPNSFIAEFDCYVAWKIMTCTLTKCYLSPPSQHTYKNYTYQRRACRCHSWVYFWLSDRGHLFHLNSQRFPKYTLFGEIKCNFIEHLDEGQRSKIFEQVYDAVRSDNDYHVQG